MRTVKVLPGQNLYDLAVEHYGHADGLKLLIQDNPTIITSVDDKLAFNTELNIIQEPVNKDIVDYCIRTNMHPVTGDNYELVRWELLTADSVVSFGTVEGLLTVMTSDNGVYVVAENQFIRHFNTANSAIHTDSTTCCINGVGGSGGLIIGTSTGIAQYLSSTETWSTVATTADGLISNVIRGLFRFANNMLVILTDSGISTTFDPLMSAATFSNLDTSDGLSSNDIRQGCMSPDESLIYMATAVGVTVWDGTTFTTYDLTDGLASDDVIYVHHDGIRLWIVYANNGVSTWDGVNFIHHTAPISLPTNDVRCVASGLLGDALFGMAVSSGTGIIARKDALQWSIEQASDAGDMPALTVTALAVDGADNVYVGTTAGLYQYTRNPIL